MVSRPIVEYLTLYSLSKNKTKSNIVRSWINNSYTELQEKQSQPDLLKTVISQYQAEWNYLKNIGREDEYEKWIKDLEKKLIYSRLSVQIISQILKKIKQ